MKNVLCWVRYTTSPSCSSMLFHSHFFRIIHFSSIIPRACLILPSVLYSATTHDSKLGRRGVSNTQVTSILFLRNNSRLFCEITRQGFQKSRGELKKSTQMRHLQSFLPLCSSKLQHCYLPDHVSIYTSAIFGNVRVGGQVRQQVWGGMGRGGRCNAVLKRCLVYLFWRSPQTVLMINLASILKNKN